MQKQLIFEVEMIKLIENLHSNNFDLNIKEKNVPRETLKNEIIKNVSRETLKSDSLMDLKNTRINNILLESSKKDLIFVKDMWSNFGDYLVDEKLKKIAGILIDTNPVAASANGIIVTVPGMPLLNKIEQNYDQSKKLIKKVLNNNYKIVYITEEYWLEIRPKYVEKVKNKELELINEENILKKLIEENSNTSVKEFSDLIEMEDK